MKGSRPGRHAKQFTVQKQALHVYKHMRSDICQAILHSGWAGSAARP